MKARRLAHRHPLDVKSPCSTRRGRERAEDDPSSRLSANAIWWLIDEAHDGKGGIWLPAALVERDLRMEDVAAVACGGRDTHVTLALTADRREIALQARFCLGDEGDRACHQKRERDNAAESQQPKPREFGHSPLSSFRPLLVASRESLRMP